MFNGFVDNFLHQVTAGTWRNRDPRSMSGDILGLKK
jgi:hypothetical protein